ncbi:MAG: hypothetical protein K8R88_11680 [Armatimonadetes bacterium]|nr:hypothetical protein [Armatimonadota bacterium]
MMRLSIGKFVAVAMLAIASIASWATADFVEHIAGNTVYGESSTSRNPLNPREGNSVDIWTKIGYSFYYTNIAIYYTTNGSEPSGVRGVASGATQVIIPNFVRNEPHSPNNIDWWKGTIPLGSLPAGSVVKYKISAWNSGGGLDVFANNSGCASNSCANVANTFSFTVKMPWPGAGAGSANPQVGYPPVSFWKEEALVGNNYMNVQLDQNGTTYDIHYPSAGTVFGVATKNEGYVGGLDTFPPGLPAGNRGQTHLNQAMAGLRVDGTTYWMSNENGVGYDQVSQSYIKDTNVVQGLTSLKNKGITVQQYDFCPAGITFPLDQGFSPQRGLFVERYLLTNTGASQRQVGFYYYSDYAINGGDSYDQMYWDSTRNVMVAYDNTQRYTSASGEYNPTTFSDYNKDRSIYFGTALKVLTTPGGSSGVPATDNWRETSTDSGQGWMACSLVIPAGQTVEVDLLTAGGFDQFSGATGTFSYQIAPAVDWFYASSMAATQTQTETFWKDWLATGTTVDIPQSATLTELFNRGLLGTMLHFDGKNGGVVAGYHNGAYPFVWPRDAAYAAVTFAKSGHFFESSEVYRYLRDVTFRNNETWGGKGFWYQKYTTDGYIVWGAPQVDESAVVPWGVNYHYNITGDGGFLTQNWGIVRDAAFASSQDSTIDSRLYYDDTNKLMHSMSVWEDAFDEFLYSNANVVRGLWDAALIANLTGHPTDAATFNGRAGDVYQGLVGRLDWNGENTDISQLGLVYPFKVFGAKDSRVVKLVDRMNGVDTDRYGNNHPLVRFSGEWQGLIDRYYGDTYWNGGPWFLSTMWYGLYYAERCNSTPGMGDIDTHKSKLDLLVSRLGPAGFGAEQISPANSELYPGFKLQAAWPNAWESMSTFVDSMMAFLDYTPDAPGNTLRFSPKLPTAWEGMTFKNVRLGTHQFDIKVTKTKSVVGHEVKNLTGNAASFETWIKIPAGYVPGFAYVNGVQVASNYDAVGHRVRVVGAVANGVGALTSIQLRITQRSRGGH